MIEFSFFGWTIPLREGTPPSCPYKSYFNTPDIVKHDFPTCKYELPWRNGTPSKPPCRQKLIKANSSFCFVLENLSVGKKKCWKMWTSLSLTDLTIISHRPEDGFKAQSNYTRLQSIQRVKCLSQGHNGSQCWRRLFFQWNSVTQ